MRDPIPPERLQPLRLDHAPGAGRQSLTIDSLATCGSPLTVLRPATRGPIGRGPRSRRPLLTGRRDGASANDGLTRLRQRRALSSSGHRRSGRLHRRRSATLASPPAGESFATEAQASACSGPTSTDATTDHQRRRSSCNGMNSGGTPTPTARRGMLLAGRSAVPATDDGAAVAHGRAPSGRSRVRSRQAAHRSRDMRIGPPSASGGQGKRPCSRR